MTVQTLAIVVLLVSFFVMIFLRFPIAYAVGLSSVLCMVVQGQALTDVCRLMVKGISSFSLMAVPFFITMGVLMGSGGISEKLIALADACVGWMRGGMAMVNIVASYFFGGISGSASADTASIGSIMIPMMVDQGYDADFSTAVTITSSCEGLLVPPSHNMVIYATTAGGISVGSLFLAGYLPGALLAIVLMIGSYIISVKENYPKGSPFTIKGFVKQLGTSIWALAAVVIVVFGVVGGVFTATESAAIAVIYSLLVSVFIYKGLDWKGVWHALDECVNTLSIVLILIATSAVFGNCLTMLHVPDLAANAITSVTSNPYIIALLIDLIILVLGMIMDMAPIILIATPILLPIATSIGIDPIQFGIIMVLNCGIGLLTPPVGAVLFIGSAVAKRPMEKVVKATLPFYLCMFIALLLLTFVPDISLAIPKLLGGCTVFHELFQGGVLRVEPEQQPRSQLLGRGRKAGPEGVCRPGEGVDALGGLEQDQLDVPPQQEEQPHLIGPGVQQKLHLVLGEDQQVCKREKLQHRVPQGLFAGPEGRTEGGDEADRHTGGVGRVQRREVGEAAGAVYEAGAGKGQCPGVCGPALPQLPGRVEQVGRAGAAGQRPSAAPEEERRGGAGGEAEAADIHAGVGQSVCNAVPEGILPQLAQKGSSAAQRRIGQRQRGGTAAHPGPERPRRRERGRAFQLEPRLAETI